MKILLVICSLLFVIAYGQTYTVGDYVNDFSGDICHNGDGTWSYEEMVEIGLYGLTFLPLGDHLALRRLRRQKQYFNNIQMIH